MKRLFDASKPGAKVIRSPMGGGWIVPITDAGHEVLECYFGDLPAPIAPLNGTLGYIVEPHDAGDLAEYLLIEGVAWEVD